MRLVGNMFSPKRLSTAPVPRAALFAFAMACVAASAASETASAQGAFYRAAEQDLPGAPGTLIRHEPIFFGPDYASAHRILYRSTGLRDEPIAVSGVVIVPQGPPPEGGRPIVAWAHPTTGVVPHCAPSLALFLFQQIQGLREMIARGYTVVATDYPGLGTPGPHPYLVGVSAGRAVLDSVRAARALADAGGARDFIVWGHSQGGQAALYTGLLSGSYAPDLNLRGVAAAAPATDLASLMHDDFGTAGGKSLTAMTLWSWSQVYGAPLDKVIDPSAMTTVERLSNECIESIFDLVIRRRSERPLELGFLLVNDITLAEPWRTLLARNTPGPLPAGIPVFLAQGTADSLVLPQITEGYLRLLCRAGSAVQYLLLPGVGHGFVARDSATAAVAWMADRFARLPAPTDCNQVVSDP
jgi:pimeloyl-ACP methyl ester carboxylesterase